MDANTSITYPRSLNAIALPIFAGLAIVLALMPLRVLVRVRNIPVCTLIVVITISNIYTFLNAIIWPTEDQAHWFSGHGLCDIQVATKTVLYTLVATSTAALTKSVADAVNINNSRFINTHAMRQRKLLEQCVFCFAVPILQLTFHFLVQARRYDIAPIYGCGDQTDLSWLSVVILFIWPPTFAILNAYYAAITICFTCKHRMDLQNSLASSGSGLTTKRFYKLGILALSLLFIYLPVTAYFLYLNIPSPFVAYSFHRNRNPATFDQVLYLNIADAPLLQYDGWVPIVMGYLIFAFFGLNGQIVDSYRKVLITCGFAKFFPSLLDDRRGRRGSNEGSGSTSLLSWIRYFNILTKACSLVDWSKRGCAATKQHVMSYSNSQTSSSARHDSDATWTSDELHTHKGIKILSRLDSVISSSTGHAHSDFAPQLETIKPHEPIIFTTPSYVATPTPASGPTAPVRAYLGRLRPIFTEWLTGKTVPLPGHEEMVSAQPTAEIRGFPYSPVTGSSAASQSKIDGAGHANAIAPMNNGITHGTNFEDINIGAPLAYSFITSPPHFSDFSIDASIWSGSKAKNTHKRSASTSASETSTSLDGKTGFAHPGNAWDRRADKSADVKEEVIEEDGIGDYADALDHLAPKKGSKAYKERERRDMALLKGKEERCVVVVEKSSRDM